MVEMQKADNPASFDIWSLIQKENERGRLPLDSHWTPPPPLLRRSSSLMSQLSLELCTENLGSETGSDGFSSANELDSFSSSCSNREAEEWATNMEGTGRTKGMVRASHACSIVRASRTFPPPLSSYSSQVRSIRREGRLIIKAVSIPTHNYLHAERHGGRLLLSFANPEFQPNTSCLLRRQKWPSLEEAEDEVEDEEEKDEDDGENEKEKVQVVDMGAMVDVIKVSILPQVVNDEEKVKLVLPSLVINNFVLATQPNAADDPTQAITATAASASVRKSFSDDFFCKYLHLPHILTWVSQKQPATVAVETKLLFTWKRKSREKLLTYLKRCRDLRQPFIVLFIREAFS